MRYTLLLFLVLNGCDLGKIYDCKKCHTETKQSFNGISISWIVSGNIKTYQTEVCDEWDYEYLVERTKGLTNWSCHKK